MGRRKKRGKQGLSRGERSGPDCEALKSRLRQLDEDIKKFDKKSLWLVVHSKTLVADSKRLIEQSQELLMRLNASREEFESLRKRLRSL